MLHIVSRQPLAKIVILDGDFGKSPGIRRILELDAALQVCAETQEPSEAEILITEWHPDILILEILQGECHALDLIRETRTHFPGLKTFVLSHLPETVYAKRAFLAGACGYAMKSASPLAINDALKTVLRNEVYMTDAVRQKLARRSRGTEAQDMANRVDCLTDQELRIFELIGKMPDLLPIAHIMGLCGTTVTHYRNRIKRKLGFCTLNGLRLFARHWVGLYHCPAAPIRSIRE